ncbi:hypothetical protein PGTUg99_002785 [Puccinia graminis f. sp. tritici]|uniref:Uncharacterized protein n=1 Tax=Puccinia graminis f. sp. tritici TaxID=56615 RepID=A0A5B0NB82_PUCGR|nr:hypothetical protein PGTUg99_002785 [Puccinia graminis f. sp. tritici]
MPPDTGPLPTCPNDHQPSSKKSDHRFRVSIRFQKCRFSSPSRPILFNIVIVMANTSYSNGRVPPLPFANSPEGLQESWLEPSLSADPNAKAFRLFHDNVCTESQFKNAYNQPTARSTGSESAPKPQLRAIYLDYHVYYQSVAVQLGKSSGSRSWDRVTPPGKCETVWKVDLTKYSWAECQQEVIRMCAPTRKLVDKHLRRLQEEGLLKWHCMLHRDATFGQNKNYFVSNDEEFAPFVEAVVNNATTKAMIKIVMEDPDCSAKDSDEAKKVDDSLALNYADEDTRLALQRVHTRLAVNPKSDTSGQDRSQIVADITRHIKAKYGCDAESMRVRDPDNPNRSIRVTTEALRAWSRAMLHGAKGVDLDTPPKCKECVPEDVSVVTLEELDARRDARLSRHKSGSPSKPSISPGGATRGLISKSTGPMFTATRRSASGRILPPRLIPGDAKRPAESRGPAGSHASNSSENPGSLRAQGFLDLTGHDDEYEPKESWRPCSPVDTSAQRVITSGTPMDPPPSRRVSTTGTDIEVLPGGSTLRSPLRKLVRSPVGDGMAHHFTRLDFERPRLPTRMLSVSPTRKRPGSQASLSYPLMDMSNKPPLNEMGRALSIDGFLKLCNFTNDDHVPRALISLNHIRRWDFFLDTTFYVLHRMGFPYPIATQLLKGAKWLEATHLDLVDTDPTPDPSEAANASQAKPESAAGTSELDKNDAQLGPSGLPDSSQPQSIHMPEGEDRDGMAEDEGSNPCQPLNPSPVY